MRKEGLQGFCFEFAARSIAKLWYAAPVFAVGALIRGARGAMEAGSLHDFVLNLQHNPWQNHEDAAPVFVVGWVGDSHALVALRSASTGGCGV